MKIRWEILTFSNLVSGPYFDVIQRKLFFVLFEILVLFAWLWLLPFQTKQLILLLPMQSSFDIGVTDAILGWYCCYRCNPRLILVLPMQSSVDIGVTNAVLGKPLISFQFLSWRHRCCNIHYSISNSFTSQKHPSYSVLIKRCYENIQRIYRGTHMPKCDFNMLFFCKFAAFLQKPFLKNTSGGVLLTFGWFLSDLPFNSK